MGGTDGVAEAVAVGVGNEGMKLPRRATWTPERTRTEHRGRQSPSTDRRERGRGSDRRERTKPRRMGGKGERMVEPVGSRASVASEL